MNNPGVVSLPILENCDALNISEQLVQNGLHRRVKVGTIVACCFDPIRVLGITSVARAAARLPERTDVRLVHTT